MRSCPMSCKGGGCYELPTGEGVEVSTVTTQSAGPEVTVSERIKGERRLGLWLSAPSLIVMVLVTAYPLGYALVLSL